MSGETLKILVLLIASLFLINILRSVNSHLTSILLVFISAVVFVFICTHIQRLLDFIGVLANRAQIDEQYISIIFKSLGVCFLADFTAGICRDCGENTLAVNSELIGKCSIIVIALPMYIDVFNMVIKLWQNAS